MSAFVVSQDHIDAMVCAGLSASRYGHLTWRAGEEWKQLTHSTADEVGAMLWRENVASVDYRYSPPGREQIYGEGWETPDQDLPGSYKLETIAPGVEPIRVPEWLSEYNYNRRSPARKPVAVLKAISCYEYQSCEHPEWDESEAKAFCDALRSAVINSLPGYDEAEWSI